MVEAGPKVQRHLAAILAADVEGYSRLMSVDEVGTLRTLTAHREIMDRLITEHGGRIANTAGDSVLAEFPSAVDAVEAAVRIQAALGTANTALPEGRQLRFRIGVHVGDVMLKDGDLFGEGINIAARLQAIAVPGGVCISGPAHGYVSKHLPLIYRDLGPQQVKNLAEPISALAVQLQGEFTPLTAPDPAALPLPSKPSIAVLPFNNMSGDPEQEYFSDGLTEDLITDLSKVSGLHVIARNAVFAYKDKPIRIHQTALELGVRYILEGSVRKAGTRVRVTGQLVDCANGRNLWADRYDRHLTDIFAIQDEITHAIVEQLKVKLLPEERTAIGRVPTENVEAYEYYLRGRQFSDIWTKSYLLLARRMFSRAVELDPQYARAYAGIADCDSALHAWHRADVSVDDILAMSGKALELDSSLPEAHASRGLALHLSGEHEEAVVEFEQALALDPNLYETNFFYGRLCYTQGDFERTAKLFERAAEIRDDDYRSPIFLTSVYRALGREADRQRSARRGLERAERALNLHPENPTPAHLGAIALAHLGERDRAREWAIRALAIDPDDGATQYNLACTYSILGDLDQALDLLEKVAHRSTPEQFMWISNDSDLESIRSHPRYQMLLATIENQRAATS
jgi:adenylate cyclase